LPALLAGGVTLMAAAAVIVWLGSSEPALEREPAAEQKPPPRYSLNHGESAPAPVEAPVATTAPPTVAAPDSTPSGMTPVTTPAPLDAGVESPTSVEKGIASSPLPTDAPVVEGASKSSDTGGTPEAAGLEKPLVAGPGQEPMDTGESPATLRSENTPPLPASGVTGIPLPGVVPVVPTQPPANTATEQITKPAAGQKPQARDAKSPPKRPARQRTVRKRKEQPIVVTPAPPVQARPTAPPRSNLWDAPTDSGFNQK
jgi:hypothetical protein